VQMERRALLVRIVIEMVHALGVERRPLTEENKEGYPDFYVKFVSF
jgi:hypothetical protein